MKWAFLAVLAAYVILSVAWSLATPPYEVSDETSHLAYVELVVSGRLPVMPDGNLEAHQPPGYYLLAAGVVKLLRLPAPPPVVVNPKATLSSPQYDHSGQPRYLGGALTVRVIRLVSTLLGAITLLLVYLTLRLLVSPQWALSGAAIAAFIPQFTVFTSAVNNDPLSYATGAAVIGCCVMIVRAENDRERRRWALGIGVSLGLMLWAKEYAMAFIPLVPLALFLARTGWRSTLTLTGLAWALCVVVALPILVRSQVLYHQPWPFSAEVANIRHIFPGLYRQMSPFNSFMWNTLPPNLWMSLWFSGGWTQINWPSVVYIIISVIALPLIVIGVATNRDRASWIPLAAVALLYIGTFYSALSLQQYPGRYLFPAMTGIVLAIILGAQRIMPRRPQTPAAALLPLAVLGLNIYALVFTAQRLA